jgi:hypothetical protein
MSRWLWFLACAILGLVMLGLGLLVPVHLRAVETIVIQQAGRKTTGVVERGLALVGERKLGPAHLLLRAAEAEGISGREKLGAAVTNLARQKPALEFWGSPQPRLETLFALNPEPSRSEPFTDFVVRQDNRERVLALLRVSQRPLARQLLLYRSLTNTTIFPPSPSSAGQVFDTALAICGLLLEEGHFTAGLSNGLSALAFDANHGGTAQPIEQVLLDLVSLGQRMNYGQLVTFLEHVEDTETLRLLANQIRTAEAQLPVLFSAIELSAKPAAVTKYVMSFGQTGLRDLAAGLRYGAGGINELLKRNQRLYISPPQVRVGTDVCWRAPWVALGIKWLCYLAGGFLLATAIHSLRPSPSGLERPLQVRGFHVAREVLFALGFLLVVLLLSEPFLAQESQKVEFPIRLRLPMAGGAAVPAVMPRATTTFMNQLSLLTLLLFFVLQGLLYTACLVKLAEIRRQRIPPRLKLRLLDNEDHLFDAGLYLGFVGTIISLIMVSLGVIKPSLMAAYSSTSFGIIFVSIFKIFHLRPARRKLVLESEASEVLASTRAVPTPP